MTPGFDLDSGWDWGDGNPDGWWRRRRFRRRPFPWFGKPWGKHGKPWGKHGKW